jgi:hypothetical protein
MLALVSNLTHGFANYNFSEKGLNEQAALERASPALPHVLSVIKGIICCFFTLKVCC